jgi:hypothetical protein
MIIALYVVAEAGEISDPTKSVDLTPAKQEAPTLRKFRTFGVGQKFLLSGTYIFSPSSADLAVIGYKTTISNLKYHSQTNSDLGQPLVPTFVYVPIGENNQIWTPVSIEKLSTLENKDDIPVIFTSAFADEKLAQSIGFSEKVISWSQQLGPIPPYDKKKFEVSE